jgi:hypothetical protein
MRYQRIFASSFKPLIFNHLLLEQTRLQQVYRYGFGNRPTR